MAKKHLLQWLKCRIDYTRYDAGGDLSQIPRRFQWMPPIVWELLVVLGVLAFVAKVLALVGILLVS